MNDDRDKASLAIGVRGSFLRLCYDPAMFWALLMLLTLPVDSANALVATVQGRECPRWRQAHDCRERMHAALDAISDEALPLEDRGHVRWYGRHRVDLEHRGRDLELANWRKAQRRGVARPWCPFHQSKTGWSTVGPHHMMVGLNVERLGVLGSCMPWQGFGVALVSAWAAGRRYTALCGNEPMGRSWCPSRGARSRSRKKRRGRGIQAGAS